MTRIPRWLVSALAVLLALFQVTLGIDNALIAPNPTLVYFALAAYLLTSIPTLIFYSGLRIPAFLAIFNLSVAALVPLISHTQLDPNNLELYATWYVMAIGLLMGATALRGHIALAWFGTGLLVLQQINWAGPEIGIQSGLPGAIAWVIVGNAIAKGLERAYEEANKFNKVALEADLKKSASAASEIERRTRAERIISSALPMLERIKSSDGRLSEAEKFEAKLLEASLRDEIRGRELMSDEIRSAVRKARERGVEVVLLDEGGLNDFSEEKKNSILNEAALELGSIDEGRVTLRSPVGEAWSVTLVASRPGVSKPDVWRKFK